MSKSSQNASDFGEFVGEFIYQVVESASSQIMDRVIDLHVRLDVLVELLSREEVISANMYKKMIEDYDMDNLAPFIDEFNREFKDALIEAMNEVRSNMLPD